MKILVIFPLLFLSCKSNNTAPIEAKNVNTMPTSAKSFPGQPPDNTPAGAAACYWQILQRDTFVAAFSRSGKNVSGRLSFDNYQKDGSSGSFVGKTSGDIMKLWYSFNSEGMKSVMEVWFRIEGDKLLRGTGEMGVRSDTSFFTNPATVDFNSGQVLRKVNCDSVPSKYK